MENFLTPEELAIYLPHEIVLRCSTSYHLEGEVAKDNEREMDIVLRSINNDSGVVGWDVNEEEYHYSTTRFSKPLLKSMNRLWEPVEYKEDIIIPGYELVKSWLGNDAEISQLEEDVVFVKLKEKLDRYGDTFTAQVGEDGMIIFDSSGKRMGRVFFGFNEYNVLAKYGYDFQGLIPRGVAIEKEPETLSQEEFSIFTLPTTLEEGKDKMQELLRIRDIYNNSWRPNWEDREKKYCLKFEGTWFDHYTTEDKYAVFAFRVQSLRNIFYKYFKDDLKEAFLSL